MPGPEQNHQSGQRVAGFTQSQWINPFRQGTAGLYHRDVWQIEKITENVACVRSQEKEKKLFSELHR